VLWVACSIRILDESRIVAMDREHWRIGIGWRVNLQSVDLTLRVVPGIENNDERITDLIHYIQRFATGKCCQRK
jgi:hypothetical protein